MNIIELIKQEIKYTRFKKISGKDGLEAHLKGKYQGNLISQLNGYIDKINEVLKHIGYKLTAEKIDEEYSIQTGDQVLYVGTYLGVVQADRTVILKDGTVIDSLDSQPQKFRKII